MKKFKFLLVTLLALTCFASVSAAPVTKAKAPIGSADSISSASSMSYTNDALITLINGKKIKISEKGVYPFWTEGSAQLKKAIDMVYTLVAPTISTTNEDGSPNVAVYYIAPVKGTDYKYFTFTGGGYSKPYSNTFANLLERKLGVVMYYSHLEDKYPTSMQKAYPAFKFMREQGARMIIRLVEDEAKLTELKALNGDTGTGNKLYLECVKVFPMG